MFFFSIFLRGCFWSSVVQRLHKIHDYIWKDKSDELGPKHHTVTMNEVLFRPNEITVIHEGKNEEPQADTGNNFFFICTGNGQSQSTKIVLKRKNF